jgi:hypothetical protein
MLHEFQVYIFDLPATAITLGYDQRGHTSGKVRQELYLMIAVACGLIQIKSNEAAAQSKAINVNQKKKQRTYNAA